MTEAERDGKLYNYAYSSVMDYAGRYTIDGLGIGKYDRAAILYGYAEKVEVFKDNKGVPHDELRDWYESDGDVLRFGQQPRSVHYTSFYNRMGTDMYAPENRQLVDVDSLTGDWSTADLDATQLTRVPYIYCSHSRVNLGDNCLTRDYGADPMERMSNILDDLDTWYITRNFARGRIGVDNYSYVGRWYGRIYDRFKQWHDLYGLYNDLLPQFYPADVLNAFLTDPVNGWGAKTWGVQNAFNTLMQTLLMPDIGAYAGPYTMADGNSTMINVGSQGTQIGVDQARYFSTSWQGDRECGYFFWECLHHVGFYLDKIMAIEAMSDSRTNFVARSSPTDLREWEVSYYTTFAEQINQISAAVMNQDWTRVGPYMDNGKLAFPNYAGELQQPHGSPIDPSATFTVQLYWQVLGQARFFSNFDRSFLDEARVFPLGTGTAPELAEADLYRFMDPLTHITYGALQLNGHEGSGMAVLRRGNNMLRWSDYCDDTGSTPQPADDCAPIDPGSKAFVTAQLLDHIELIKIMADITPIMDYENPYAL